MPSDPRHPEINAVADFLQQCVPFDLLPEDTLHATARQIQVLPAQGSRSVPMPTTTACASCAPARWKSAAATVS
ncbi:MAG: hypothetical protein R3F38_10300 [Gammaproteobacteria bacterium]